MAEEDKGMQLFTPYKVDLADWLAFVLGLAFIAWWLL